MDKDTSQACAESEHAMDTSDRGGWTHLHLIAVAVGIVIVGVAAAIVTPRLVSAKTDDGESASSANCQSRADTDGRCGTEEKGGADSLLSKGVGLLKHVATKGSGRETSGDNDAEGQRLFSERLSALRNAIEMYATEHDGNWPDPERIEAQLTSYTDAAGNVSDTRGGSHRYGPYLTCLKPVGVGPNSQASRIGDSQRVQQGDRGYGWIYDGILGEIRGNTGSARDAAGKLYRQY
jgi:type II secretory pathway pseudopilin PulG